LPTILPVGPDGSANTFARSLAYPLARQIEPQVIVDNRHDRSRQQVEHLASEVLVYSNAESLCLWKK
jgi:hypothetical protein